MPLRIEDYAMIGDLQTAALVGRDGSIDWLCLPRFDSPACFASLVGNEENGRWLIAPAGGVKRVNRRYRDNTLVLETTFETEDGRVTVVDCMPPKEADGGQHNLVRLVVGEAGTVPMHMDLVLRFDYGRTVPWVHHREYGLEALSGPNAVDLHTPIELAGREFHTVADFTVSAGDRVPFVFVWRPSIGPLEAVKPAEKLVDETEAWWSAWAERCNCGGPWEEAVSRSVVTLKGLTDASTGAILAAPTTSLPEWIGGERNWDYRFCWLRDATFTLYSLLVSGLTEEAVAWRDWLLRAAAGRPEQLQTIYGAGGERLLPEVNLDWLDGYEGSTPVRLGNKAYRQLQIDVYGELLDVFHVTRRLGVPETEDSWGFQKALLNFLESGWRRPDNGIWEVRGRRRRFTHSQVMAWVGLDRVCRVGPDLAPPEQVRKWQKLRDSMHAEICREGYDAERKAFVQYFGGKELDASLLQIPLVGFLPPTDPRVMGTVKAIEKELTIDGFVRRYLPNEDVERVYGPEGVFLPCTFWLADNYAMAGRFDEARNLFERLLAVRNDVGLLSEEYDPHTGRLLGNFPQAFSHVALVNTAQNLQPAGPAVLRGRNGMAQHDMRRRD